MQLNENLNRYTKNYVLWIGTLKTLLKNSNDVTFVAAMAKNLLQLQVCLPKTPQYERTGIFNYKSESELIKLYNEKPIDFGKLCLQFANSCIYDKKVYTDDDMVVYESTVDNCDIFWAVIFADYLVNIFVLTKDYKNVSVIIKSAEGSTVDVLKVLPWEVYFPNIELKFV